MAKPEGGFSKETLDFYKQLIATIPSLVCKGKTMPYTSLNGHMFSFLSKDGELALRLPAEARELFIKIFDTALCMQYGRVMKEYVVVPADLVSQTEHLKEYFDISFEYVSSLKPKPTKKIKP
ncbi:MAG: hypothetical protein MUO54_07610 [Anaerolineales bacterium]|nr:hypothetical protein [Anaerolineales bacterium]